MPGARCARSRVWCVESTRVSHRRYTRKHPAFPAQWFYGLYRALPGDRAFLPPSPRGIAPQGLISASGYQDHTTSPYAAALSSGLISIEPDAAASIASRAQRVMTIAIRPSVGRETAGVLKLICPTAKAENFCERGWTLLEVRQNAEVICPSGTICTHSPRDRDVARRIDHDLPARIHGVMHIAALRPDIATLDLKNQSRNHDRENSFFGSDVLCVVYSVTLKRTQAWHGGYPIMYALPPHNGSKNVRARATKGRSAKRTSFLQQGFFALLRSSPLFRRSAEVFNQVANEIEEDLKQFRRLPSQNDQQRRGQPRLSGKPTCSGLE